VQDQRKLLPFRICTSICLVYQNVEVVYSENNLAFEFILDSSAHTVSNWFKDVVTYLMQLVASARKYG
jgi:hypothetical protein